MAPVLAASAAFGYINPQQHNQVSYSNMNACLNDEIHFQENGSAPIILLTNLASFIESVLFGSLHALSDIQASARIISGLLASLIVPSSTKSLTDVGVNISLDASTSTFLEPPSSNTAPRESGCNLALLTSVLLSDEDDNVHLDYSISQLDVLRMSRAASKRVRGDSVDQSSVTIHHNERNKANLHEKENSECMSKDGYQVGNNYCYEEQNELICSSHEDSDDVLDSVVSKTISFSSETQGLKRALEHGDRPEFSWLIVPEDPVQDALTRVPKTNEIKDVSESSSILFNKSGDFDICHVHFLEDENLEVNCGQISHLNNSVDSKLMMIDLKKDATHVCQSYEANQQLDDTIGLNFKYFKRIGTFMKSKKVEI